MHLTSVLLVGIFSTTTLQQCPPPSSGACPGGCPSATPTSSPGPSDCPTTASSQPASGCPTAPSTTTPSSGCPTTSSSQPASGCPSDPSTTTTASSPTGGCTNSGSGPSPGNGAGCDSCAYPAVCENPQGSADVPADTDSPYYDQVVSISLYKPGQDNGCTTLFPIGNGTSLLVHCIVFVDGSYEIDIKAIYAFTGSTGVFRGEALFGPSGCSTCVYNDFILGSTKGECKNHYVFYRCHLYGDCVDQYRGADAPMTGYSLYDQYNISNECKRQLISFMRSQQLNSTDFVQLPNNLPHQCVTQMGGMRCYRADSVEPGTGLSLP